MGGFAKYLPLFAMAFLSACPLEKKDTPPTSEASPVPASSPRTVTLDANYNHPLDASAWTTLDASYSFTPPATLTIVQGTYSGDPGWWLRASLWSGSLFNCYYVATSTSATTLTLDSCDSIPDHTQPTALPKGATILLSNVTAAGLMVEANFTLNP
jgi:hypothetical protein